METLWWLIGSIRDFLSRTIVFEPDLVPEPTPGTKAWYEKHATPECVSCSFEGKARGMVKYWRYQDESEIAPCFACFPDDPQAKRTKDQWDRERARDRFEEDFALGSAIVRSRLND